MIATGTVLVAPSLGKPLKLQLDACKIGAGAVLLQNGDDGIDHPVSFFSSKFNFYQFSYCIMEKEVLALIWALRNFKVYEGGGVEPLVVYTNHPPLPSYIPCKMQIGAL